jgi:hypothetical protein
MPQPSLLNVTYYAPALLALLAGCGGGPPTADGAEAGLQGSFPEADLDDGRQLEFSSRVTTPAVADVQLRVGALSFEAHFDYARGQVVTDGHGLALDHEAHTLLRGALENMLSTPSGEKPLPDGQDLAGPWAGTALTFEQRALYAALVVWAESGGIPVFQKTFALPGASEARLSDKSLGDDGVSCITRGESYEVSFNYVSNAGDIIVEDRLVTADTHSCNGLCGPACVLLTPFQSWTLDCLEHDECCSETDGGPDCWVPLGECGDEYERAVSDFLLGVDPFASHCGG